ncbi:MAG: nucleotide exchange factor GrpE [Pseudanabaenaceae cyanobacterium]
MPENPMNDQNNHEQDLEPLAEELVEELDPEALAESLSQLTQPAEEKAVAVPEPSPQVTATELAIAHAKIDDLTKENSVLKQQVEEFRDQYLRLRADFENFRKRMDREKEELETRLTGKFLERFLPVLDDFERAQAQIVPKTDGENIIHRSYQSVYKQLHKTIKDAGLVKMETIGQPFNPNYHEAIAQEPSAEYEENVIFAEVRAGYLIGDRVLRHALVKVSAGKVPATSENLTNES